MIAARVVIACGVMACAMTCVAATPSISAGGAHTLALKADGTVRAWGSDGEGQLGIGRRLYSTQPTPVEGLAGARSIAAADGYSLAVKADGTVWAWGYNGYGQLADGTNSNRSVPNRIEGLDNVTRVAARHYHVAVLKADGTVWMWGNNGCGELGDGTQRNRDTPAPVPGLSDVIDISVGTSHSVALKRDGTVWAWGCNDRGQLGDGTTIGRTSPVRVSILGDIVAISAGWEFTFALGSDGTLWTWGSNGSGQLGDGGTEDRSVPRRALVSGVVAISAAGPQVALRSDGTVWAWGYGELGNGTPHGSAVPVQVTGLANIVAISSGGPHAVARRSDGTLWTWGWNTFGELGDGTVEYRSVPVRVTGFAGAIEAAAGYSHTLAINASGLWAWGEDKKGQLGSGTVLLHTTPVAVSSLTDVVAVAAGHFHSVALKGDGTVWTWGTNAYAQLGYRGAGRSTPGQVPGIGGVVAIAAGAAHTVALKNDGTVWAWGIDDGPLPSQVAGLASVSAIAAGWDHSLALRSDGSVWAWGGNGSGQLGDGTTEARRTPVPVVGLPAIRAISAGNDYSLALGVDGVVRGWGTNSLGELGDGTRLRRLTPVPVRIDERLAAISAGAGHALAIDASKRVWAWGDSSENVADRPFAIQGIEDVAVVAAGRNKYYGHSTALTADAVAWGWNFNDEGQLGDGTLAFRKLPVIVVREGGSGTLTARNWFLDLDPAAAKAIPDDKVPRFLVATAEASGRILANLQTRPEDVGTQGSVYVFALAPDSVVRQSLAAEPALKLGWARRSDGSKADVQCVLAQLTTAGQLTGVSAASLQAYVTGVLTAQIQAVTIVNGVATANIGGATFYVGYGTSGSAMFGNGTNRSVATVPGGVQCKPQAPQTGWWWNPAEDGRGYSIEVRGNNLFFASFLYDVSGRSNWYVATGPVSLDGSLFNGELLSARGGQALGAAYSGFPTLRNEGPITLAFNDASVGTLVWPGGAVPIQRFNIVPNGLMLPPVPNQPESGWWWNEAEAGRGFFLEWQGGILNIAGYMYDDQGNPVWYLTQNATPTTNAQSFSSNWWSFGNGMTLMGPWRPHTRTNDNVAPVTIEFQGSENAIMTLPNGRTTALTRHRF